MDWAWCRSLPWPGVSMRRNFLCVEEVGSWVERYWSEEAVVPTGREHSTDRGVWEVCVEAGVPRSNWVLLDDVHGIEKIEIAYKSEEGSLARATWTEEQDRRQCGKSTGSEEHCVQEYRYCQDQ